MLSDWYYIVKSLEEAKAIKGKATDTGFIDQMASWFPTLFVCESPDEFSKHKRSITKAISNERGKEKLEKRRNNQAERNVGKRKTDKNRSRQEGTHIRTGK